MTAKPADEHGLTLGRYELIQKLGSGGMAEVYLARIQGMAGFQKTVALKRIFPHLHQEERYRQRFVQEAKTAAAFSHPNIVQVYDLGVSEDSLYIAMELVLGMDLATLLARLATDGKRLAPPLVAVIAFDVLEALNYVHHFRDAEGTRQNLVHRDISPQNLLIDANSGSVKLCDFGMARPFLPEDASRSTVCGKLPYMSPEQCAGEQLDIRSDLYSLGLVLHEVLCGRRTFAATQAAASGQRLIAARPLPLQALDGAIPPLLAATVERALYEDRERRFQTPAHFSAAIEEYLLYVDPRAARRRLASLTREMSAPDLGATSPGTDTPLAPTSESWHTLVVRATGVQPISSSAPPQDTVPVWPLPRRTFREMIMTVRSWAHPPQLGRRARRLQLTYSLLLLGACLLVAVGLILAAWLATH